jgi:two-component system phosphate regulon sensor histidine kinase PhoR
VSTWTVTLSDTQGRSIAQLVARERWTYGALVVGMLAVMIAGLALIARASARAAELSRLKTDFVANVSHELKTPLALIRMFGETLESGIVADDDKRRTRIQVSIPESARSG